MRQIGGHEPDARPKERVEETPPFTAMIEKANATVSISCMFRNQPTETLRIEEETTTHRELAPELSFVSEFRKAHVV